jgi:ABC-2 type transport system ATP-binding protein
VATALELSYSGTALNPAAHVFGQIVDRNRGVVLGNQATPIPLVLDGRTHAVSRALEGVAASVSPGSLYVLQLVGGTTMYGPTRNAGVVRFGSVRISLPAGAR